MQVAHSANITSLADHLEEVKAGILEQVAQPLLTEPILNDTPVNHRVEPVVENALPSSTEKLRDASEELMVSASKVRDQSVAASTKEVVLSKSESLPFPLLFST